MHFFLHFFRSIIYLRTEQIILIKIKMLGVSHEHIFFYTQDENKLCLFVFGTGMNCPMLYYRKDDLGYSCDAQFNIIMGTDSDLRLTT